MVHLECKDHLVKEVQLVQLVVVVSKVKRDHLERWVLEGLRETEATEVCADHKEFVGKLETLDHVALVEIRESKVLVGSQVSQECEDSQE
jgi:hypothetical protein